MSKTTLVTQQVQLQEWFQMMQESKGRPQQIPLDGHITNRDVKKFWKKFK